jgi:hypothetical protein
MPAWDIWDSGGSIKKHKKKAGYMAVLPVRVQDIDGIYLVIQFLYLRSEKTSAEKLYPLLTGCKYVRYSFSSRSYSINSTVSFHFTNFVDFTHSDFSSSQKWHL